MVLFFMNVRLLGYFSLWPLGGFLQAKGKVVFVRMCAGVGGGAAPSC